ncbi:MAG: glycosyltransferase family 9 protein [Candidatus Zophobacter franzmannii]|nr:glycosyltransferase family 9 protein [Candidatus Zophobacter franzmannii]
MKVRTDCREYRGDLPCKPHKLHRVKCDDCSYYAPFKENILIIKLGAAGDVIRTTPILHKIRTQYPHAQIVWLTLYPLFVPNDYVDTILKWDLKSALWLQSMEFDLLFNLDKDKEALGLATLIKAKEKRGYLPNEFGKCVPADDDSTHKWRTGIFDDECIANTKSYPQEIVELCGYKYSGQKYIFNLSKKEYSFDLPTDKPIIGLNTGCGTRWLTRLWGEKNWISLSDLLARNGFVPVLLGGPEEDELNRFISDHSKATYLGTMPLDKFCHLFNQIELCVTSVTMAMHIAIGLNKKLVLLNNIFNKHEFELYGLGNILEPDQECLCCYKNTCPLDCMVTIKPQTVFENIQELLK